MIYVYITNELKTFETDIRDMCLAFFPFEKIKFLEEGDTQPGDSKVFIKDFFSGDTNGERIVVKSEVKRQLYDYLSKMTTKKLLWGTLTGIRPVTMVTRLIEDSKFLDEGLYVNNYAKWLFNKYKVNSSVEVDDNYVRKILLDEYYVSKIKSDELIEIAKNEIEVLNRSRVKDYKNSYSIYVGVPFCKSTCLYCSFTSFNIDKFSDYVDKYLFALEEDFKSRLGTLHQQKLKPLTLYIGGGTPTSLDEGKFEKLLFIIDKYIDKSTCIEYTVEAGRPDTITKEKLLLMKVHGVTRISINPQSFNQKTLDLIGRKHTVNDVIEKFSLARNLGFGNINMDIILGLPNEHLLDVLKTLNGIRKLKPESFTVHSLALKRAARLNYEFADWTKNYYLAGMNEKEINKMFFCSRVLADMLNLHPYYLYRQKNIAGNLENVGYAKKGKECIYNIMMMSERHSVYGFGTATTKEVFYENGSKRIESIEGYKSVVDYVKEITE